MSRIKITGYLNVEEGWLNDLGEITQQAWDEMSVVPLMELEDQKTEVEK